VVPSNMARYGLSEVVNRLLSSDPPVPFDFLVEGEFLRTTVAQYLETHRLSSEKALRLEYVLALSEPEHSQVDEAPDWIAGITTLGPLPSACFAAVSYDGTVRLYEESRPRLTARLSDRPLTAITALPSGSGSLLLAAGKDGCTKCFHVQHSSGDDIKLGPAATLRAPTGELPARATEAVAISEDGTLLASAGWNNEVLLWNADPALFAEPDANESAGAKRKAGAADAGEGVAPKFTLAGHSQVVSSLLFGARARFPFTLLSGSWDCSVRVWDAAAASCVCNWTVARAVTSFSLNPDSPQLATSHEDGHISIWDIRAAPHPLEKGALSLDVTAGLPLSSTQVPHRRMASQVCWCPEDATRLASVGHDGQLCILDPRSPKMPLQSLRFGAKGLKPTKLLCASWLGRDKLVLGGSDGKVVQVALGAGSEENGGA